MAIGDFTPRTLPLSHLAAPASSSSPQRSRNAARALFDRSRAALSPVTHLPRPSRAQAASGPLLGDAAAAAEPTIFSSESHPHRSTVGWSGTIGESKLKGESHLGQIARGQQTMDRLAPGFRQKLDDLVAPDPALTARMNALDQQATQLWDQNAKLLSLPDKLLTPEQRTAQARVQQQLSSLEQQQTDLGKELRTANRARFDQAIVVADALLSRLRHQGATPHMAQSVKFDAKATKRLAEDGLSPQQVTHWVNEFHGQTGLPAPSRPYNFTYYQKRPEFLNDSNTVNIGDKFSKRMTLHEVGHRIEYSFPELSQSSRDWVAARARADGEHSPRKLQDLVAGSSYGKDEVALKDSFYDPYVGRVYEHAATEVLTTGLEHFSSPERLARLYQRDPEHVLMTLGALDHVRQQPAGRW